MAFLLLLADFGTPWCTENHHRIARAVAAARRPTKAIVALPTAAIPQVVPALRAAAGRIAAVAADAVVTGHNMAVGWCAIRATQDRTCRVCGQSGGLKPTAG